MAIPGSRLTMIGVALAVLCIQVPWAAAAGKSGKICGIPADITLILDSSASIRTDDFNYKLMPFVKTLVTKFHISPEKVRLALLTYGHEVNKQHIFNFDQFTDEESLLQRLETVTFVRGEYTRTDLAVKYARKHFLPIARPNVKKIEIILTDGVARGPKSPDNVPGDLAAEIQATKAMNVTIFAIGVGHQIKEENLKAMATSEEYTYHVGSYSALEGIIDFLEGKLCIPETETCGDTDPDVVFTMDSSRMDLADVNGVFKFITAVTDRAKDQRYSRVRVGLVTGECLDYGGFQLGALVDKVEIGNYLDQLGQAEIKPLVTELIDEAFLEKNGGRKEARRVGVIVVPAKVKDFSGLLAEASRAKQKGIEIFAIGIGNGKNQLLQSIASSPSHVMQVSSNSVFESTVFEFVDKLCKPGPSTLSPKPTPKPTPKPKPKPKTTKTPETTKKPDC